MKLAFLLLFSCAALAGDLTIIAVSGTQGQMTPKMVKTKAGELLHKGGMAQLAAYIKELKSWTRRWNSDKAVVLIDSGNLFHGTLASNTLEGRPVVDFYNHLELDATAIGNHEFSFGPVGPHRVPRTDEDPRGALKAAMARANFPFLSINIRRKDTGHPPPWAQASVVLKKGRFKIGVIGASSPGTPKETLAANVADLNFLDPAPLIAAEAARLRDQERADFVIVTYNQGENCQDTIVGSEADVSSCTRNSILPLIDQLPAKAIDAVVMGRTRGPGYVKSYKGVALLLAAQRTGGIAWAELSQVALNKNKLEDLRAEEICDKSFFNYQTLHYTCDKQAAKEYEGQLAPHRFLGKILTGDPWVQENIVTPNLRRVEALKQRKTKATLEGTLESLGTFESPVGRWFTDILTLATARTSVSFDFAMVNNGGLRNDLATGLLTYGDLFELLPFDDNLAVVQITPAQIRSFIETQVASMEDYRGLSFSRLKFTMDSTCQVSTIDIAGKPLEAGRTYKVLTNDFIARGGVGFADLGVAPERIRIHHDQKIIRDLLFDWLSEKPREFQTRDYSGNDGQGIPPACLAQKT